ncbi:hypothetical protein ACIRBZ_14485 [Streptomyces sp. NPDC094038]|uniref:hypothetical protein n=1 Tax=Streptomyces sp. NPDC094038 TaxID=3366055 RepID=UPI0038236A02
MSTPAPPPERPVSVEAPVPSVNGPRSRARRVGRVGREVRGGGRVLTDVSVDAGPGQLTVIAGSSGAGKTVLL